MALDDGLLVAVPHVENFPGGFLDSLLYTWKPSPLFWKRLPGQSHDTSRTHLVQHFLSLQEKPKYFLFIDADATWDGEAFKRLMERDLPMVCGAMFRVSLPPTPTMGVYVGQTKDGDHQYRFDLSVKHILKLANHHNLTLDNIKSNAMVLPKTDMDLMEIDGCGMHFTMIRRDVLETVKPPWFIMGGKTGAGEDFFFCRKVREAGFPIYFDASVYTGHIVGKGNDYGIVEMLSYQTYVDEEWGIVPEKSRMDVEDAAQ